MSLMSVNEIINLLQQEWYRLNDEGDAAEEDEREKMIRLGRKSQLVATINMIKRHNNIPLTVLPVKKPECNHQRYEGKWIPAHNNGWEDVEATYETQLVSTYEDLSIHRYRCTQCNEIFYYSGAAKRYYETGVDEKGLFKNEKV